ncbi:MAG: SDR family oxidoreductase [Deltaproteobacteria bacterium]|nr:SDR family oxidoreductase [Deltaproteobacteria bacterium]
MDVHSLFDLTGKTAIVTGGGIGLGRQMACALAEAGCDIVICSRKVERCEDAASEIEKKGVKALALRCDISKGEEIEGVVSETVREFGKIDILVNNAGRTWGSPAEEIQIENWNKVVDVNVTGTFQFTQRVGREMIKQGNGKIINIASYAGLLGSDPEYMDAIVYNVSKGAIVALTKDLATKWAKHNINVNAIAPGWFSTPMTEWSISNKGDKILNRLLIKRFGGEDDLKGAVVFLASRASDYMTGHVLCVDGGLTAW